MKPPSSDERPSKRQRSLRAMGDVCNGAISESEGQWLEQQLREDPALREVYVDYMTMHACLSSEAIALGSMLEKGPMLEKDPMPEDQRLVHPAHDEAGLSAPSRRSAKLFGKSWLVLAASVVFVSLFAGLLGHFLFPRQGTLQTHDGQVAENRGSTDAVSSIARITGTQNCRWGDSGADIGYGSEIDAGQMIRLSEGIAEITFEDGATMLLESPATVVFHAAGEIEVREGRLAAIVPPGSSNLCIRTKTFDLHNVDTAFGLLARKTGNSELHVFNGTVKADVLNAAGEQRQQLEVHASEAVLASALTTTVFEFQADETHFVRSMSPGPGPHDGLLAYEGYLYPEGPLSEQNGGFGWAGPWSTIAADREAGPESNSVSARGLAVEGLVPRGNHAAIVAQRNRIRRSLASSVGGVFDVAGLVENQNGVRLIGQDGTTVYLSFLQRVNKLDDGFYGLELHRGDGNANRVLCIGNGADEAGYGVTSAVNIYGAKNFPALGTEDTKANLFVIKISFGADDRDTVEVFRNPASLDDEGQCVVDALLKGNFAFDRISLANFDGSKTLEVDELCVGTHFIAVTGRWGGERGRLLRRFTQERVPKFDDPIASSDLFNASNSRNLLLLATIAH
ncbi:MAG: hypothetical protein GXP24_03035 [Planctomycetes bacterium]|nr:hypothetical protein [Planctomycetota bacterium]